MLFYLKIRIVINHIAGFTSPFRKTSNIISHLDKYLIDDITIIRPIRDNDNQIQLLSDLNEIKNKMFPLNIFWWWDKGY